jgi:hypothetical protein
MLGVLLIFCKKNIYLIDIREDKESYYAVYLDGEC